MNWKQPEVWGFLGMIFTTILGWIGKGLYGRRRSDAEIKDYLQSQTDKLYVKINELMTDQLQNREQLMKITEELHTTQREVTKYKADLAKAKTTISRLQARIRELEKK